MMTSSVYLQTKSVKSEYFKCLLTNGSSDKFFVEFGVFLPISAKIYFRDCIVLLGILSDYYINNFKK